jgi:hypothetical protein
MLATGAVEADQGLAGDAERLRRLLAFNVCPCACREPARIPGARTAAES